MAKVGFVTRFSLSNRTAIGVQTRYIIEMFPDWLHFYWSTPELLGHSKQSYALENKLLGRAGYLSKFDRSGSKTHWKDDELKIDRSRKFVRIAEPVSAWYFAPIESQDSARIRQLVTLVPRPFILHLWDHLDGELKHDADLMWLFERAEAIAVNSLPLKDDVEALGYKAELIMFTRPRSLSTAKPYSGGKRKVALLGNISSYMEGVSMLLEAIAALNSKGAELEPLYIGSSKQLKKISSDLAKQIPATGWLSTESDRDRALASCFAGCLPGPYLSAEDDFKSRYSIPSRCLDFLAVNLPMVGSIEPNNATARFLKDLGLGPAPFCRTKVELEEHLRLLLDENEWMKERSSSQRSFDTFLTTNNIEHLRDLLTAASLGITLK